MKNDEIEFLYELVSDLLINPVSILLFTGFFIALNNKGINP